MIGNVLRSLHERRVSQHLKGTLTINLRQVVPETPIGLAVAYWIVAGLFNAMGNVNTLPAFLAAWSPDLLFGITGTYLFRSEEHTSELQSP